MPFEIDYSSFTTVSLEHALQSDWHALKEDMVDEPIQNEKTEK